MMAVLEHYREQLLECSTVEHFMEVGVIYSAGDTISEMEPFLFVLLYFQNLIFEVIGDLV